MRWQGRSRRKPTGGLYSSARGKRKIELGREAAMTHIAEERRLKRVRTSGGGKKFKLLRVSEVVVSTKAGKSHKIPIETVLDNPANKNFIRRNIITKGTIIQTEIGSARVTSRPGQDGIVNAVLVESKD